MKFTTALALITLCFTLSACANTVRGIGSDVEKAGETLQKCC